MKRWAILISIITILAAPAVAKYSWELGILSDPADEDWVIVNDVSDTTTMSDEHGAQKRILLPDFPISTATQSALNGKQDRSAALDAYATVTPTSAILSLLGAADLPELLGLLSLTSGTDFYSVSALNGLLDGKMDADPGGTSAQAIDGTGALYTRPVDTDADGEPDYAEVARSVPGSGITGTVPESVIDDDIARDSEVTEAVAAKQDAITPSTDLTMRDLTANSMTLPFTDGAAGIFPGGVNTTPPAFTGYPSMWPESDGWHISNDGATDGGLIGSGSGATIDDTATGAGHTDVTLSATEIDSRIASASSASGAVTPPTYSDDPCTYGQYAFGVHDFKCLGTNEWDYYVVSGTDLVRANWSNPTPSIPTYTGGSILAVGNVIQLSFSEAVTQGSGWSESLFTLDASVTGSDIGMTVTSGDGSTQITALLDSVIQADETVTLNYPETADGLESSTGGDLAAISGGAVTNLSEQGGVAPAFHIEFDADSNWTDGYTMGGNDINAGDTTGTVVNVGIDTTNFVSGPQAAVSTASYGYIRFDLPTGFSFDKGQYSESRYFPTTVTDQYLFQAQYDADNRIYFRVESSKLVVSFVGSGTTISYQYSTTITADTFHTVDVRWDSSGAFLGGARIAVQIDSGGWQYEADGDTWTTWTSPAPDMELVNYSSNYGSTVDNISIYADEYEEIQ